MIAVAVDSAVRGLEISTASASAFPSIEAFVAMRCPSSRSATRRQVEEVFAGNQEGALAQLKRGAWTPPR